MLTTETHERLSYKEIGLRLRITTDAARMKAKRMAKAGRWRLIPGNHPNDPVTIEVPVGTLPKVDPDAMEVQRPAQPDGDWMRFALAQVERVERLTADLLDEKEAHGRTTAELVAAEARELGTAAELANARREIEDLKRSMRRRFFNR